jgi:hypothetical protein
MTESFFGGAQALSFRDPATRGVKRGGRIVDQPQIQPVTKMGVGTPELWPDGRPKQQLVVTLLCDGSTGARDERDPHNPTDVGKRRLYVKGYMVAAIRDALQQVGVTDIAQGGTLMVAWIDEKPSKTAGNHPAKVFAAQYIPPAVGLPDAGAPPQNGLSGAPSANPFGGGGQQPPAPQVPAQPTGYDPNQYQPPAAPAVPQQPANPFAGGATVTGPPVQQPAQPAPVAPPANPFA